MERKRNRLSIHEIVKRLPNYITLDTSTYINTTTKARFIDKDYGEFWMTPNKLFNGRNHKLRSKEIVKSKLSLSVDDIKKRLPDVLELDATSYVNRNIKARFIDKEYGEFWALPKCVLRGSKHPKRKNITKLSENDINQKLPKNCTIDYTTFNNIHEKARFVNSDLGDWWARPNNVFKGYGHPKSLKGKSKPELEIFEFVKSLLPNSRIESIRDGFEIDIFIKDYNIGIEYHGLYWHNEFNVDKYYHFKKREYFQQKNIQLLQILADEWQFKRDIIKSIIRTKLGLIQNRYQARKTILKSVTPNEATAFLKENHLMGDYKSAKHIGLYYQNELVSMLSYKKYKNGIDISRFCNKINTSVAGGLSRLIKEVKRQYSAEFIQSWVDLRYGNGESLTKIGFSHKRTTLGWKWTDNHRTYNRLKCRANMDNRQLSENEHAKELRLVRIYDAGQALFMA